MKRLWLTEEQAKCLARALRAHIQTLYKCADEMHYDKNLELEEKYIDEANALDTILDILTEDK